MIAAVVFFYLCFYLDDGFYYLKSPPRSWQDQQNKATKKWRREFNQLETQIELIIIIVVFDLMQLRDIGIQLWEKFCLTQEKQQSCL